LNPSITTKGTNLSVVVSGSAFFRRGKNCRADLEEMKFRLFYFRSRIIPLDVPSVEAFPVPISENLSERTPTSVIAIEFDEP